MSGVTLGQLLLAALGGGFIVKLLDIVYQEIRRTSEKQKIARDFVDQHLDPLLKATDEMVGKLRSLGAENFKSIVRFEEDIESCLSVNDFASLLYLIGRFWGQIEVIRREGISVAMSGDPRGKKLQSFLDCLESRRVRIVDRVAQRAIGEIFFDGSQPKSFVAFANMLETDAAARRWIMPLVQFLSRMRHTTERQKLLAYGTVSHALIDTLDPKHLVTRDRPWLPARLRKRSWVELRYRVFGVYLDFVKDKQKYIGPPRGRPNEKGRQRT